jgi:hypothetical protein
VADKTRPPAVKVGDSVRVAPTSPMAESTGFLRQVLEVFVLEGVTFAVLTPRETTIPPIVPVNQLVRVRFARTRARGMTASR